MSDQPGDTSPTLADLLDVDDGALASAIGDFAHAGTEWDGEVHVFTGRANPRVPERPVVALRVTPAESEVEVGRAVGVPLPDGRVRWTLAAPRTRVAIGDRTVVLAELGDGIIRVLDADMLRGVDWSGAGPERRP